MITVLLLLRFNIRVLKRTPISGFILKIPRTVQNRLFSCRKCPVLLLLICYQNGGLGFRVKMAPNGYFFQNCHDFLVGTGAIGLVAGLIRPGRRVPHRTYIMTVLPNVFWIRHILLYPHCLSYNYS